MDYLGVNNLKKIGVIVFFILLLVSVASADRFIDYEFREGIINAKGNLIATNNPVNNVNAIGFVCSDKGCNSVSSSLFGGTVNNPTVLSSGSSAPFDMMQLVYPDQLQSNFGYGVYFYKDGYVLWEQNPNWKGTSNKDPKGPFIKYLSKIQDCDSQILDINIDKNNVFPGTSVNVDASLESPLDNSGSLGFVPPSIQDQYQVNVDATLDVFDSNNNLVDSNTQNLVFDPSSTEDVSFSFTPNVGGDYNAILTTSVPDAKCLNDVSEQSSVGFSAASIGVCGDGIVETGGVVTITDVYHQETANLFPCDGDGVSGCNQNCDYYDIRRKEGICGDLTFFEANVAAELGYDSINLNTFKPNIGHSGEHRDDTFMNVILYLDGVEVYNERHKVHKEMGTMTFDALENVDIEFDTIRIEHSGTGGYIKLDWIEYEYSVSQTVPPEECDDGNFINGDGCDSNCVDEFCGDGIINDVNEICDDGILNGQPNLCNLNCDGITPASCGNGIPEAGEDCDDGNIDNTDACKNDCTDNICGDTFTYVGVEDCDDGQNGDDTDSCTDSCVFTFCGDSIVQLPNGLGTDGPLNDGFEDCDNLDLGGIADCTGLGYASGTLSCDSSCAYDETLCVAPVSCGNGILDLGEGCDDFNTFNGDGCDSLCQIESGWICTGEPSVCRLPECSDGVDNDGDLLTDYPDDPGCTGPLDDDETDGCSVFNLLAGTGSGGSSSSYGPPSSTTSTSTSSGSSVSIGIGSGQNTNDFAPLVFMDPNSRLLLDDNVNRGRLDCVTVNGVELCERQNNYAFEGEQVVWDVFVYDKNGINKVRDVFVAINPNQQELLIGNDIQANCFMNNRDDLPVEVCNINPDIEFNPLTMGWYTCILSVETPMSMQGEYWVGAAAEDLTGLVGVFDEREKWFFNPYTGLSVIGQLGYDLDPGDVGYSTIALRNAAEPDSGVMLDMFISGTDFYDSSHIGGQCPTTNQLSLSNFDYYAVSGAYSTVDDIRSDSEGYVGITYGNNIRDSYEIIFNDFVSPAPPHSYEYIEEGYSAGNVLSPGSEMSITLRLDLPEPCNGDYSDGDIFFWAEAV